MQTNPLKLILNRGEYYNKLDLNLALLKYQLNKEEPEADKINYTLHEIGNKSLGGVDDLLTALVSKHKVLTETNLSDFQDLYDACKSHQKLLNILKLKVFDYIAQAKKIREALPGVFGLLEAIANGREIDTIKQTVTDAVNQLKTILKPFLPQATIQPK